MVQNVAALAPEREGSSLAEGAALVSFFSRLAKLLGSPAPYLMLLGLGLWLFLYWLAVEGLQLPRFAKLPGLTYTVREWVSLQPSQGISLFTAVYWQHIMVSCRRVLSAFAIATSFGVGIGLLMGWSRRVHDYLFALIEMLRPIPILAWVPLAIIMFKGFEAPVIFLATLASFFVTILNTVLGVRSIDTTYFRAAGCLGASRWHMFRDVVIPGATPFIITGLQISIGVCWFSLVAAEMVSGDHGLGYLIVQSYMNNVTVPMAIGMITLGFVGWFTSALVRLAGERATRWRARSLAIEGR